MGAELLERYQNSQPQSKWQVPRYRLRLAAVCQHSVIVALAALAPTACGDEDTCDLGDISRDLGGVGLVDCGIAGEDTAAVDRCAVAAYGGGNTFRALSARDDGELEAVVRTAGGDYLMLRLSAMTDRIERADCAGAEVVDRDARTYVQCIGRGEFRTVCE